MPNCKNAVRDLYAQTEGKPLWQLLADFEPENIVRLIDFKYIEEAITPGEALDLLRARTASRAGRLRNLEQHGYLACTKKRLPRPRWANPFPESIFRGPVESSSRGRKCRGFGSPETTSSYLNQKILDKHY
jgi:hypothetical protein